MMARHKIFVFLFLLLAIAVACGGSDDDTGPSVKIISPSDQYDVALGESLRVESRVRDNSGVARVELHAGNSTVDVQEVPEGEKSYRAQQSWSPVAAGSYSIAIIAYDEKGQPSDPVTVTVNVGLTTHAPAAPQIVSGASPTTSAVQSGLPDLDIVNVSGNLDLAVGEPLALLVTVRNHGPGATDKPALVRLTLGEGVATESYAPPLPAGGQVVVAVSLSDAFSREAELDVGISVDPDDEINEAFEDNNTVSVRLKVKSP
jgi:subtilase family serine protease